MKNQTKFESRKVADLIPYARNARTHSDEQVAKLAGSIKEFGFINPVIISNDGGILAGHGRVMAAQKLGIEEVPCIVESHLSETQKRAYILADNRLALDAGWDEEMLRLEIQELSSLDFDLSLTGFSDIQLSFYSSENENVDTIDGFDFNKLIENSNNEESSSKKKTAICPECGHEFIIK